jgi:1-phosphofructokinase
MTQPAFDTVTVTLNPAIDRTVIVPNFTAGAVNRVETVRSNPGGKGVNVAAALADAGQRVAVTGFLGRENPASFEALFAEKRIVDSFIRIPGQTRVGIKVVDPALGQTTDLNFPGATASRADVEFLLQEIASLEAACFVLAGSLPPGVDPMIYHDLVKELRSRGRRVVLDASGEPLRNALDARPHLIKPNLDELGDLLGTTLHGEVAAVVAARQLIAEGIEMVVVSMGKDGAALVTTEAAVIAQPPQVEVRSTVGAGDAMVAGLVVAHARGLSLAESARLATAFSVHALTRGSDSPAFDDAIQALLPQVTITAFP